MKITKISNLGLALIKKYEGFKAKAYLCPANVITIGFGSTYYEDGSKVKLTDSPITQERATELLEALLVSFERSVDSFCRDDINQTQFDALCVFIYNVGPNALRTSTLLKKVNKNPNDPLIAKEFAKYKYSNGKISKGLINRRLSESQLYFS